MRRSMVVFTIVGLVFLAPALANSPSPLYSGERVGVRGENIQRLHTHPSPRPSPMSTWERGESRSLPVAKLEAQPVTVPFELLKTKHIAVMVKINGKGPYRMIFDTGAPLTLLNNKVAKEAGVIDPKAKKAMFSPFGPLGMSTIKSLEIGDLKAEDVPTTVMDHPTVSAISSALGPIEGLIGFPFFARYKMTIDYQAKQFTFVPNGYQPEDITKSLTATLMAISANQKPAPIVLAPAAQWGLVVGKDKGDEETGVLIKEVVTGGAAAEAGLEAGDRLLSLDDRWTDSVADTYAAAGHVKPGAKVFVVVKRSGKEMELAVIPRSGF